MQYNYDFEIASLVLMLIILLHFTLIRQCPSDKTKVFGVLLWTCIVECGVNILSCLGLANADVVPQIVNELLALAFFALEGVSSYLVFRYILVQCEFSKKVRRRVKLIGAVPLGILLVLVVLNPFTGFFFYFKDGVYYQGFGAGLVYLYVVCYFVFILLLIVIRHNVLSRRTKIMMLVYTAVAVGFIVVQCNARGLLLTSAGKTLILLMMYLAMQNPSEMLDPVTNVGNESALLHQLKNLSNHKKEATVITLHLRKFHNIVTVLGIENSNALMREISRYLFVLCGKFHVFRIGGDTFTMVADTKEDEKRIIEAVLERFEQDWEVQQNHIVINTDMVVLHYPMDFATPSEYLEIREFLLEEAAASEDKAVIVTDEKLIEKYRRRAKIERALDRAISERSFEVHYQPIYSPREQRIVSLEALVRLRDAELGLIYPDEFIPVAERDGSVIHIGRIVLEECAKFLAHHVLSNASLGIRTIHVNLSAVQCMRQDLVSTIVPILERYHIPPSMISLEVTEWTAIRTPERLIKHMSELGELGIAFAMDDYGAGNSNCIYLRQFPFQEIKIDKEIVWAYFDKDSARIVLENEIRTIQELGLSIVVEGVETKEQSEAMERLGVNYIQGYYYGMPMPEKECLRHIRSFNQTPEDYARQQ